ncbi:MAG: phage tail tape measure protein [Muribaculaceae bacterium]|nr:phage tail tape measure protein [Muribaculaceae bacterium]
MKDIPPGTEVWNSHIEQIKTLKSRLAELNEEVKEQKSAWDKFKSWSTGAWPAIDLINQWGGSITGVARDCVDAFASMDQEMANVRKFTGMSAEQVADLNEEFKKMDTRTSREDLNKLAQEAGRLGKSAKEDILGFVRAADQINVALDDLGEGATLTLSKLTGIFGDEARYGTEQSLLKVGSVINELSQNCSASAPYLAEFASRLGGVGAQANMSIPQIMGFAAVLDSNAQQVEASATAVSQVLVRMMADPAKYAKVAGLDVQRFTEMLKTDANGALILFLETLQKAGGMDVLSPMFKDMGENGARAITALSTLATHIDEVKAQQEAANQAFIDGTSVGDEFAVQNSTVQAGLEKCRKAANELKVELGERLAPLMAHIMTSTSALIRAGAVIVDFLLEHKGAIITLTAAISAYTLAIHANIIKTKALIAVKTTGKGIMIAWTAATKLGAVAMALLTGNITKARTAWVAFSTIIKANPLGLAAAAIVALGGTLFSLIGNLRKAAEDTKKFHSEMESAVRLTSFFDAELIKEKETLDGLFDALNGAVAGSEAYNKARQDLMNSYGDYIADLVDEKGRIIDLEGAYQRLSNAIRIASQERGINKAKDSVENVYSDRMESLSKELQESLEHYGATAEQAARITQSYVTSLAMNAAVPEETLAKIQALSGLRKGRLWNNYRQPAEIANEMGSALTVKNASMDEINKTARINRPLRDLSDEMLGAFIETAQKAVDDGGGVIVEVSDALKGVFEYVEADLVTAKKNLSDLITERAYRSGQSGSTVPQNLDNDDDGGYKPYVSDKDKKKQEAEAKREAAKAKKEFKAQLDAYKAQKTAADAEALALYRNDSIDYEELMSRRHDAELNYYNDSIALFEKTFADQKDTYLQDDKDYQALLLAKTKAEEAYLAERTARELEAVKRWEAAQTRDAQHMNSVKSNPTIADEIKLQAELFNIRKTSLERQQALYKEGSKEYADLAYKIETLVDENTLAQKKLYFKAVEALRGKYEKKSAAGRYALEKKTLDLLLKEGVLTLKEYEKFIKELKAKYDKELPGGKSSKDSHIWSDEDQDRFDEQKAELSEALENGTIGLVEYYQRLANIEKDRRDKIISGIRSVGGEWNGLIANIYGAYKDFLDALVNDSGNELGKLANLVGAVSSAVGAGMQIATEFSKAEAEIQIKAIEDRYDREVKLAQGNAYKVAKAEKKKEQETAKVKNEASKKQYVMQVVQAVAQSIQAGLNAYSATAAIPIVGPTLAPIAMGIALAQGAVQVALLKKQQQAAAAQGYSKGGFTKPGPVDEPAGVVHAGEWVASQKLLANPVARPLIDALDLAQRTNTIGSLRAEDVSRSIRANDSLVRIAESDDGSSRLVAAAIHLSNSASALSERLNEPFVTVNTVTGDKGIKQAQDDYDRLLNNVTPKSKRK